MKFSRLLKESKLFWPSEIVIEDGKLHEKGGGYFPTLTKTREEVEQIQDNINEWHSLMSWVIFCGFHKAACEKLQVGNRSPVKFSEINKCFLESNILDTLNSNYSGWPKNMRSQFVSDAKP